MNQTRRNIKKNADAYVVKALEGMIRSIYADVRTLAFDLLFEIAEVGYADPAKIKVLFRLALSKCGLEAHLHKMVLDATRAVLLHACLSYSNT